MKIHYKIHYMEKVQYENFGRPRHCIPKHQRVQTKGSAAQKHCGGSHSRSPPSVSTLRIFQRLVKSTFFSFLALKIDPEIFFQSVKKILKGVRLILRKIPFRSQCGQKRKNGMANITFLTHFNEFLTFGGRIS